MKSIIVFSLLSYLSFSKLFGQAQVVFSISYSTTRNPEANKPYEKCDTLTFLFDRTQCYEQSCNLKPDGFDPFRALNFYYNLDSNYYIVVYERLKAVDITRCIKTTAKLDNFDLFNIAKAKGYKQEGKKIINNFSCTGYSRENNGPQLKEIYWVADSLALPDVFCYTLHRFPLGDSIKLSVYPSFLATGRVVLGVDRTSINPQTGVVNHSYQRAVSVSLEEHILPEPDYVARARRENYQVFRNSTYEEIKNRNSKERRLWLKEFSKALFDE